MNPQGKDHNQDQEQEQEQEYEYDSMSSAPSTPKNSEGSGEKKKKSRGLKKLFTRKKSDVLDKSPSLSARGLAGDEGVGSESRRRSLTNFLKRGSRTPKKDDEKSSSSETSPEKKELHARDNWVDASKEDTKPNSKLHTLAEKLGEEAHHLIEKAIGDTKKQPQPSPTEAKVDDKGKAKEHQEPEFKHDHHHHHEQNEHPRNDVKEENIVTTEPETVKDEARDMVSPPPLHDKECFGCESLAKGLQHVCLPWTVKKEDH